MDREQEEMQFLGLFGIYLEAYKVVFRWRKIFSKITLSLILPLSFIFLAHMEISHELQVKIWHTEYQLHRTGAAQKKRLSGLLTSEHAIQWTFNVFYFIFLLIFSLLSTSAVVYTIASIYTGREVTFKKVMSVVPKVWKRLMVTFFCTVLGFFAYNFLAILILLILSATVPVSVEESLIGDILDIILLIVYLVILVCLSIIWHLASVVTVLEDSCGIKAMMKSKELIKGKMLIVLVIFFKLNLSLFAIRMYFALYVVRGRWWRFGMLHRIGVGLLCFLLLLKLILFGLVIQTIIYFVCKSYHHENIDKSELSDHLEVYLGEYEPLKSKDVQLEQYEV